MSQGNNCKHFEQLPFEIRDVDDESRKKIVTLSTDDKCLFVGPKRYVMPDAYREQNLLLYNFEARQDDVWLVGFPRSGTTLHCEMIWLIGNDLNFEKASEDGIGNRFPHFDFSIYLRGKTTADEPAKTESSDSTKHTLKKPQKLSYDYLNALEGRRFLKSHLPLSLMPPNLFESGAKVIYCARNPKDVVVSLFYLLNFLNCHLMEGVTFKDYVHSFMDGHVILSPFFEHIKEAWARRNDENFLFLFYEDCLKDKKQTIEKVAKFLGKTLTKDQVFMLDDHLSFEKFRKNKSVNWNKYKEKSGNDSTVDFIRRGKAGTWRDYFDEELAKEFDDWVHANLEGSDLKFPDC